MPGRETDSQIIDLLRQDRRAAFTSVLEQYQNKVFRLAYSILGNRALAEEAAQEAFVKAWKALPRYDGTAALSTWLYAIARNTCLDEVRRSALRREMPLEEVSQSGSVASPDAKLDAARVLARLPEMYRRVLTLFYLEGRSYEEVAEMLGLPLGTVKSHLYRAKAAAAALIVGRRGPMMEESTPCGARTTRD